MIVALSACVVEAPTTEGLETLNVRTLDAAAPRGLSGLGTDLNGNLWAVAEMAHAIIRITPADGQNDRTEVVGVADGLELESIAFLGDGRVAFGTESDTVSGPADLILIAAFIADRLHVVQEIPMDYDLWNAAKRSNTGIEGLCSVRNSIIAIGENVLTIRGERVAPIGKYDLEERRWHAAYLRLTSTSGKISAVACRYEHAQRQVNFVAVERHYGVRHIIQGQLPLDWTDTIFATRLVADMTQKTPENLEGIEWLPSGELVLISDNRSKRRGSYPSRLLRFKPCSGLECGWAKPVPTQAEMN